MRRQIVSLLPVIIAGVLVSTSVLAFGYVDYNESDGFVLNQPLVASEGLVAGNNLAIFTQDGLINLRLGTEDNGVTFVSGGGDFTIRSNAGDILKLNDSVVEFFDQVNINGVVVGAGSTTYNIAHVYIRNISSQILFLGSGSSPNRNIILNTQSPQGSAVVEGVTQFGGNLICQTPPCVPFSELDQVPSAWADGIDNTLTWSGGGGVTPEGDQPNNTEFRVNLGGSGTSNQVARFNHDHVADTVGGVLRNPIVGYAVAGHTHAEYFTQPCLNTATHRVVILAWPGDESYSNLCSSPWQEAQTWGPKECVRDVTFCVPL